MKDGAVDVGLGQEARDRRAGGERKCLVVCVGSGGKGRRCPRVAPHNLFPSRKKYVLPYVRYTYIR